MASGGTNIAWTSDTWNPLRARDKVTGKEGWACVRVSPGCFNCYAATLNRTLRFGRGTGLDYTVPALERVDTYIDDHTLEQPMRWKRPRRIFVCSMTDLFGEWVTDEQLDRIFAVMALTPRHTYQVLTKRPERMREYVRLALPSEWQRAAEEMTGREQYEFSGMTLPLPNVWLLVSAETQNAADERIPILLDTPAAVRGVSLEPLLGPVDIHHYQSNCYCGDYRSQHVKGVCFCGCREWRENERGLDWVIVGGESGPGCRPMDMHWVQRIHIECDAAGVAYFGKQRAGARPGLPLPEPLNAQAWPV